MDLASLLAKEADSGDPHRIIALFLAGKQEIESNLEMILNEPLSRSRLPTFHYRGHPYVHHIQPRFQDHSSQPTSRPSCLSYGTAIAALRCRKTLQMGGTSNRYISLAGSIWLNSSPKIGGPNCLSLTHCIRPAKVRVTILCA